MQLDFMKNKRKKLIHSCQNSPSQPNESPLTVEAMRDRLTGAGKHLSARFTEQWLPAMQTLCQTGGYLAQLDHYRLQFRQKYLPSLRAFSHDEWFGWVTPGLCCKFAPKCAEHLFWVEKALFEKGASSSQMSFPSGDTPVKTLYEKRGRLTIPDQLAVCLGIEPRNLVFVMPRACGVLELWKPARLTDYCTQASSDPKATSLLVPRSPAITTAIPNDPVQSEDEI